MGHELCTPYTIREMALDEIVLEEIRSVTYYARANTAQFVSFIQQKSSAESRRELNAKTAELGRLEKRNGELNALFKRLYEDHVLGKVTSEQFRMLSEGYNEEQRTIQEEIPRLRKAIEDLKASATNVERFLEIVRKYTDIKELTPEIQRTFISKIVIHERSRKHAKDAEQDIDIYFAHIGNLNRFCSDGQSAQNQTTA